MFRRNAAIFLYGTVLGIYGKKLSADNFTSAINENGSKENSIPFSEII